MIVSAKVAHRHAQAARFLVRCRRLLKVDHGLYCV